MALHICICSVEENADTIQMMVLECGNAYVKYRDVMPPFRANNLVHGLIDTPSNDSV